MRAEDPSGDLGPPPTFPPDESQGSGPGFSEKKKKDDEDEISAGSILAAIGYSLSVASLYYSWRSWPKVQQQGGEALRILLKRPDARWNLGELVPALQRMDEVEPQAIDGIGKAYVKYRKVFQKLAKEMARAVPGPPAENLESAKSAWQDHAKALLELKLVRSDPQMKGELKALVSDWSPRTPLDNPLFQPDALEQWLSQDRIRASPLYTTEPGRRWLIEHERLKGQFALQWWRRKGDASLFDQWASTQSATYRHPAADDLDSVQAAGREHVQALLELGLVRSNARLKSKVADLVSDWLSRPPPNALDQWLAQDSVRKSRLFTTDPGRQWLAEFDRLKGQLDWKKRYEAVRNEESSAVLSYTRRLQKMLARCAPYALSAPLKERLQQESEEAIEEPETFKLGTKFDPGRRARQPGELVMTNTKDKNSKRRVSAGQMKEEVSANCTARFALAGRAANFLEEISRHPKRRLIWPAYVVTSGVFSLGYVLQGAWHLVPSPALKSLFFPSRDKTEKP